MKKVKLIEQVEFYYEQLLWLKNKQKGYSDIWANKSVRLTDVLNNLREDIFNSYGISDYQDFTEEMMVEHLQAIHKKLNPNALKQLANVVSVAKKRKASSYDDETKQAEVELQLSDPDKYLLANMAKSADMTQSEIVSDALHIREMLNHWKDDILVSDELKKLSEKVLKQLTRELAERNSN